MSIAQKEAHNKLVNSGKAKTQQEVILNLLRDSLSMNREQIAKWTGFKESSVTGRCSELVDEGKLIEIPIAGVTYYSYVYADELKKSLKERKKKERTKRVLNALIKDDEAFRTVAICMLESKIKNDSAIVFCNKLYSIIKNKINGMG